MIKQYLTRTILLALVIRLATGCATIVHGSSQDVNVSSSPDDAEVWVDGARIGKTPTRLTLKRGESHLIKIQKEGFKDVMLKVDKQVSAWIIGNVIFGGIIGCGIDFISGGAYDLKPDRLDVNLSKIAHLDGGLLEIYSVNIEKIEELRFLNDDGLPVITTTIQWVD